jgi:hypothetical protein
MEIYLPACMYWSFPRFVFLVGIMGTGTGTGTGYLLSTLLCLYSGVVLVLRRF